MKTVSIDLPNPTLVNGGNDYRENCSFSISVDQDDARIDSENIVIPVSYSLNCGCLQKLIDDGMATAVVTVRSSTAGYLRLAGFEQGMTFMELRIPKYSVSKNISLSGSIIATKDIEDFDGGDEWNRDYFGGCTFDIRTGGTLAMDDGLTLNIETVGYEHAAPSIFKMSLKQDQQQDMTVSFDDDRKIMIYYNERMLRLYGEMKHMQDAGLKRSIMCITVMPALTEAVMRIHMSYMLDGMDCQYQDFAWAGVIERKLADIGIDLSDPDLSVSASECADRILGNITFDSLDDLEMLRNSENEERLEGGNAE